MLYQIPNAYKDLVRRILACQTEEQFATEINDSVFPFEEKNVFVAKEIKNLEAEINAVKQARDEMSERLNSLSKDYLMLQEYVLKGIDSAGLLDPIKAPEFEIKTRNNPPAVEIYDETQIPDLYIVTKEVKSIDKKAISRDIKDDFEVPGAKLIRRKTLIIK
jgi:hypothetical protein